MDYRDLEAAKTPEGFWFRAKQDLLERLVVRVVALQPAASISILVAGCGTGSDLAMLGKYGRVSAVDCDPRALGLVDPAVVTGKRLADVCSLPYTDGQFHLAVAFELLEHVADDSKAVAELHRVLGPGGTLLVSVPAYPALCSAHDRALGHLRRYRRSQIRALLSEFQETRVAYWNSLLFPAMAMLRLAHRHSVPRVETGMYPAWIDRLLGVVLMVETRALLRGWSLPFGLSLVGRAVR